MKTKARNRNYTYLYSTTSPAMPCFRALIILFAILSHHPVLAQAVGTPQHVGLFESDTVLDLRISGDLKPLMNDRSETPSDHPLMISYSDAGQDHVLSVSMRTRGHFRKTMGDCDYPPLLIAFHPSDSLSNSIFRGQKKTKLVVPCRDAEYVIREWLVYRIHAMLTPMGFRARLVRLTLADTRTGKAPVTTYAMLLEEEGQMAARNKMISVSRDIAPERCEPSTFLDMALFEYFIGNTDWSVQYGQNVKLIAHDSLSIPFTVPYDFDQCGLVSAPYAHPAEELQLSSVQVRRYRGYCVKDLSAFDSSLTKLQHLRPRINDLVNGTTQLSDKTRAQVIRFLDGFYATMADPKKRQRELSYPCDPNNPGVNVVIRGLRTN